MMKEQSCQISRRARFFRYLRKTSGGTDNRPLSVCGLNRPGPMLGAERTGPERCLNTPRVTRFLCHVATCSKRYSKEHKKSRLSYLGHFLGQVKVKDTRCHQGSNFVVFNIFFYKSAHILKPEKLQRRGKAHSIDIPTFPLMGGGGFRESPSGFFQIARKGRRCALPFLAHLTIHLFRICCETFRSRSRKVRSPGHVK